MNATAAPVPQAAANVVPVAQLAPSNPKGSK
jgi:hypothetical protein